MKAIFIFQIFRRCVLLTEGKVSAQFQDRLSVLQDREKRHRRRSTPAGRSLFTFVLSAPESPLLPCSTAQ